MRERHCSLAIAGGVNVIVTPEKSVAASKAGLLSANGRCCPFSAAADGYVRSEGCGVVVLKSLVEAQDAGDLIQAVVLGSATLRGSGDTDKSIGIAQLMRDALRDAMIHGSQVGMLEAHGSGVHADDLAEMKAIADVVAQGTARAQANAPSVVVGSVKGNIGHLEGAAGIAGLLKIVLSLKHRRFPGSVNVGTLDPRCKVDHVVVPTASAAWRTDDVRTAGVTSLGSSGTNAHVLLQEYVTPPPEKLARPVHVLALSAPTDDAVRGVASKCLDYLKENPTISVLDYVHDANLCGGFHHLNRRAAAVIATTDDARRMLECLLHRDEDPAVRLFQSDSAEVAKIGFGFSDAAVSAEMGAALYETQPIFRETIDACDKLLADHHKGRYLAFMRAAPTIVSVIQSKALPAQGEGLYAALQFALQLGLAKLWMGWGVKPEVVSGTGVGQFVAAVVSGALNARQGFELATGVKTAAATTFSNCTKCPLLARVRGSVSTLHNEGEVAGLEWGESGAESSNVLSSGLADVCLEMNCGKTRAGNPSVIACAPDWASISAATAAIYVKGVDVDWALVDRHVGATRLAEHVPSYAPMRKRCWYGESYEYAHELEQRATAAASDSEFEFGALPN